MENSGESESCWRVMRQNVLVGVSGAPGGPGVMIKSSAGVDNLLLARPGAYSM